jgi:hypothetical protein
MKGLTSKEIQYEMVSDHFREEAGGLFKVYGSPIKADHCFEVKQVGCKPVFNSIGVSTAATYCAMRNTKIETKVHKQTIEHIKELSGIPKVVTEHVYRTLTERVQQH